MIELDRVSRIYRLGETELRALDDVTLTIADGEFVAIMGASGSGKSTLMNVIGCLDIPSNGVYLLDGIRVSELSRDELAALRNQELGFVFQSFNLLPRTPALEQVELPLVYSGMPRKERKIRAAQALTVVGLGNRLTYKPNQLSGGQQQRVAIARAVVNNPRIILADEPTGNLDSRTSLEIIAIFQRLNLEAGITVIYVTHERDIALHAKRVIRMSDGRIASDLLNLSPLSASDQLVSSSSAGRGQLEAPKQAESVAPSSWSI